MKSERRHELEKNILADRLESGIQSVQGYLAPVLGGIVILVIGFIGWGIYRTSAKTTESAAWTEYYFNLLGGSADSFLDVAEDYPTSSASAWSRLTAGNSYLNDGITTLYRNRASGEELIEQAIEAFEEVGEKIEHPELRVKALFGLGQAHESLGELDEATGYYQQVVRIATREKLVSAANERLVFLASDSGKDFYDWFTKLDPKPDAPVELPSNLSLPPSTPDIQFGTPGDDLGGAAPSGDAPETPAAEIDPATLPALPKVDVQPEGDSKLPSDLPPLSLEPAVKTPDQSTDDQVPEDQAQEAGADDPDPTEESDSGS